MMDKNTHMDYASLAHLKKTHPALKLLAAKNAPLIISFLHQVFIAPNHRSMPLSEAVQALDEQLYSLHEAYGHELFPKSAQQYIDDWCDGKSPFLSMRLPEYGSDEPELDLLPSVEKAIEWVRSLEEKQFVGTESRLLTIFRLLQDLVQQTEEDPELRIAELERQKASLDHQIVQIRAGKIDAFDSTRIRERYFEIESTARTLLSDFRQVEENFRKLDRETRAKIATSDAVRGTLLDDIFHEHDVIRENDQGKSFRAFWEYLMNPARQDEFDVVIDKVLALEDVVGIESSVFLAQMRVNLLDAGDKVHQTQSQLSAQLRKFLDDQSYLENKRIAAIISNVEKQAVKLRDTLPFNTPTGTLDAIKVDVNSTMSRHLYRVTQTPCIETEILALGEADIDMSLLHEQHYVDPFILRDHIRSALQHRSQITLAALCVLFPPQQGVAEIMTYLHMACDDTGEHHSAVVDHKQQEFIVLEEIGQVVKVPQVIFTQGAGR